MVSITATGTIDDHIRNIKRRKARNITTIMKESSKKSQRALLKMFEVAKENNEIVGSDWEAEIELEDDMS
jgi:effector-binding domain-containing protein